MKDRENRKKTTREIFISACCLARSFIYTLQEMYNISTLMSHMQIMQSLYLQIPFGLGWYAKMIFASHSSYQMLPETMPSTYAEISTMAIWSSMSSQKIQNMVSVIF